MMISVPVRIWCISMVILALSDGQSQFWECIDYDCYEGSFINFNQYDANKYCEERNLTSGILSQQDYKQVAPFARNYTWIGIRRDPKERWTYLSGESGPVVNSTHQAQEGEVVCAYQHISKVYIDACYTKKKYVCQNVSTPINCNCSVHHTPLSWFEARNDCIRQGGDLYEPKVYDLKIFGDEQYWVGVRKDLWTWTASGKEVDVTYWDPSQPQGNGSCVTITRRRWYLFDCQEDRAKALCVNQSAPVLDARSSSSSSSSTSSSSSPSSLPKTPSSISEETFAATRSLLVPSASLRPPENINPLTDSDAFPQSTLQQNELPSMHTTHSPKDADSNSHDENKTDDKAVVDPVTSTDNDSTGKYIGVGVAGAVAVLVIGLGIGFALWRFRKKEKTETQSSQEVSDNNPRDDQYQEVNESAQEMNESAQEMNESAQAEACGSRYMNCETTESGAYSALNYEAEPENPYFPLRNP